ncbi:MAG: SpoIID/LytB domain-containing protein, partial [Phycisphaerales bacterium]
MRRAALHTGGAAVLATTILLALVFTGVSCESMRPGTPQPTAGPSRPSNADPAIRVRLGDSREAAEFASDGSMEIIVIGARGQTVRTAPGDSVLFRVGDRGWSAEFPNASRRDLGPGRVIVRRASDAPIRFMNGLHDGEFTLLHQRERSPGVFDVIERVPMDTYIAGVIAKELYANWSTAAYEAQAIAARTYAMHEQRRQLLSGREWDIESTDADQVYAGTAINPTALNAARATSGQVLRYKGHLIRAYYSSTCGGRSASARDIWPTSRGYEYNLAAPIQAHERACACDTSPLYRWEVKRTNDDTLKRIVSFGERQQSAVRAMTSLRSISVDRVNNVGRPTRYKLADDAGKTWTITA